MPGLSSLLNIGKVGLLTHQTNLQTTGHNVANVNTRGYSRQEVTLEARTPSPSYIGPLGNGVKAVEITRDFDRFITNTLFDKTSVMSGLETRQSGMKLIEGVLNEVDENGLNELMNQFWAGWDDVSNDAEAMAERTTLLQRASLLVDQLRDKYNSLIQMSHDVDLNIDSNIKDINQLSKQVAELNVQIVSAEASGHSANDLRDQRDDLIKKLSGLTDIHYFETERGSVTVLIGQGNPLVEGDSAWQLDFREGKVYWSGKDGQSVELTTSDVENGELGGWIEIKSRISPRDTSILTSSQINTTGGKAVKMSTLWGDIDGVTETGPFTISISGTTQEGLPVTGSYDSGTDYDSDGISGTLADFATFVENRFLNASPSAQVRVSVTQDGRLNIEDLSPGDHPISFQVDGISGGVIGLDLGKFDGSYPLNYVEQLNRIGRELIKTVNSQHAQGVGLIRLQETTATNEAINPSEPISLKSSGLEFSEDIHDGEFEIWLYGPSGDVIDNDPSTPLVNDPVRIQVTEGSGGTSLEDLRAAIDGINGLRARILNGRLVIGVDDPNIVGSFAFGRDTSGATSALGLNSFFTGYDAATIGINEKIQEDPRLIAAAQVGASGAGTAISTVSAREPARPLGISIQNGTVNVSLIDPQGSVQTTKNITIDRNTTSLKDVVEQINQIDGIDATIKEGLLEISTDRPGWSVSIDDAATGDTHFLEYLGMASPVSGSNLKGTFHVERTFDPVSSYDTNVSPGNLIIELTDNQGAATQVNVALTADGLGRVQESLEDIAAAIDSNSGISAEVVDGRLRISAEGNTTSLRFLDDTTGLLAHMGLNTPAGGDLSPANNQNALAIRGLNRQPIADLDNATIGEAYQGLIGTVGIHSRGFQQDYDFSRATVDQLQARRDEVSGVSLDEEMADLIKFQHAYTAAAKLIKAADEMFMTLLETK